MMHRVLIKTAKLSSPLKQQVKNISIESESEIKRKCLLMKSSPISEKMTWFNEPVRPLERGDDFGVWLKETSTLFKKNFNEVQVAEIKKRQAEEEARRNSPEAKKAWADFMALPEKEQSDIWMKAFKVALEYSPGSEYY